MRPKDFDPDEAADRALHHFWEAGYTDTNMPSLMKAMGITRGSFYNTFGSKRTLFLKSLTAYITSIDEFSAATQARASNRDDAVRSLLEGFLSITRSTQGWKGCLIGNTTQEAIAGDDEVADLLRAGFERICLAFEGALALNTPGRAHLSGDRLQLEAVRLASALQGLLIAAKCQISYTVLNSILEAEVERIT